MKKRLIALVLIMTALVLPMQGLAAYSPSSTSSYAQKYALSPNTASYPYWSGGDCTNFASQSIKAGGITTTSSWHCTKNWYTINNYFWDITNSWSQAPKLMAWLGTSGNGYVSKIYSRKAGATNPPPQYSSYLCIGELVFLDWEGDGTVEHTSVLTTVSGSAGSLQANVCQHTSNRKNVIWTLEPYMSADQKANTKYYILDVD